MKKIVICLLICISIISSTYGSTNIQPSNIKEDNNILVQQYTIKEDEENLFLSMIDKNIKYENKSYRLIDVVKKGGTIRDSRIEKLEKKVTTKSNILQDIMNKLESEVIYNENEYKGSLYLAKDSIRTKTIDNGSYEKLLIEEKEYINLYKSDLNDIPKTIYKDKDILYLTNCEWEILSEKSLDGVKVPELYRAKTIYKGIKVIKVPNDYITTVTYLGNVEKVINNPLIYELKYEKVKIPFIPIILGISGILVGVVFIFRKNTRIYNFNNGKWKCIGKININKKNLVVNLIFVEYKAVSNKYKIKTSKKYNDKYINIITLNKNINAKLENRIVEVIV